MRNRTLLVWGIVLVAVGLIGVGVLWSLGSTEASSSGGFSSAGQRIYYTGMDAQGRAIPRSFPGSRWRGMWMMADVACVDCHGEDGRGGTLGMMFGSVRSPDIRYSALTRPHSENGKSVRAWEDADIRRAIRDGMEPDGEPLELPMPRWDMTRGELDDVIDYLKELDAP